MPTVNVRPLRRADIQALLRFETANRDWFESQIDPRAAHFYSLPELPRTSRTICAGLPKGPGSPWCSKRLPRASSGEPT